MRIVFFICLVSLADMKHKAFCVSHTGVKHSTWAQAC